MFTYSGLRNKPKLYGPRWASLEDAPELVRPLLVEAGDLPVDGVVNLLPAGTMINAHVGNRGRWIVVESSKETFWDAVREGIKNTPGFRGQNGEMELIYLPDVLIQKVEAEDKSWEWSLDEVDNDPRNACLDYQGMQYLSFSDDRDFPTVIKVLTMLSDIKAKVAAIRGGAE